MNYKSQFPKGIDHIEYKNITSFWTKKEYQLQQLIINGFAVRRESLSTAQIKRGSDAYPKARIDIYYDTGEGIGSKKIIGDEQSVYKEATKFLDPNEINILNIYWKKNYSSKWGNFDWNDPGCKKDLQTDFFSPWMYFDESGEAKEDKDCFKKNKKKIVREDYPLRDLFLTGKFDASKVVDKKDLSTFYKHTRGDLELTKRKAMEYGSAINVAPQSLMFEPMRIPIWGNVNFNRMVTFAPYHDKLTDSDIPEVYFPGNIYHPTKIETVIVPAELYRVDIKAVKVNSKESIYDGFVAYYYEGTGISENANNKLCLVREDYTKFLKDDKAKPGLESSSNYQSNHEYYLGIYQIYGTKERILNPDPTVTGDHKIMFENTHNIDLVIPIISFTKPEALEADKMVSNNLEDAQKLGRLIREEQANRINIAQQIRELRTKVLRTNEKIGEAKIESLKNLQKSRLLVEESEKKHKIMYEKLKDYYYKHHPYRVPGSESLQRKKPLEEISLDDLGYIEEVKDDSEVPKFLEEKKPRTAREATKILNDKIMGAEIDDIDQVFANGDKIKLYEIERLIQQYEGSKYLEDKLKNDPIIIKLFDGGLDVSERFEEVRKQKASKEKSKFDMKKLFNETQAVQEEEEKIA